MPIVEIEDILLKFRKQEEMLEIKYKDKSIQQSNSENSLFKIEESDLDPVAAKIRNENLLKELEVVKGNLRSKSIFSPAEMQWEKICEQYQMEPSLPVTSWRCNYSVFV